MPQLLPLLQVEQKHRSEVINDRKHQLIARMTFVLPLQLSTVIGWSTTFRIIMSLLVKIWWWRIWKDTWRSVAWAAKHHSSLEDFLITVHHRINCLPTASQFSVMFFCRSGLTYFNAWSRRSHSNEHQDIDTFWSVEVDQIGSAVEYYIELRGEQEVQTDQSMIETEREHEGIWIVVEWERLGDGKEGR